MSSESETSSLTFHVNDQQTEEPDYSRDTYTVSAPPLPVGNRTYTASEVQTAGITGSDRFTVNYQDGDSATLAVDSAWNSIKNVLAESTSAAEVTLHNVVNTDVRLGNGGDSKVSIDGAKRGDITTGDGNDAITITATSNGGSGNDFNLSTGMGDDTVGIKGDGSTLARIDTGSGDDAIVLSGTFTQLSVAAGDGADRVDLSAANFDKAVVNTGAGDDTVTIGIGRGAVDTLVGGTGFDTVQVRLTAAQYTTPVVQDLIRLKQFMADPVNVGKPFLASSLGVTVTDMESLQLFIDGQAVSIDNPPTISSLTGGIAAESTTADPTRAFGAITATDVDGDTLTYSVLSDTLTHHGTLTVAADGNFVFTAKDANWNGTDRFTVRVADNLGGYVDQAVSITITPTQDAPVVVGNSDTAGVEDAIITGKVVATDVDGDRLRYSLGNDAQGNPITRLDALNGTVTIDPNTGAYRFVPRHDWSGTESFIVQVSDGTTIVPVPVNVVVAEKGVDTNLHFRINDQQTWNPDYSRDTFVVSDVSAFHATDVFTAEQMRAQGITAGESLAVNFTDADSGAIRVVSGWNTIKSVQATSERNASVHFDNVVNTDVIFGEGGNSGVAISGAKRGDIVTASGNDTISIVAESNDNGWDNTFNISSGAGGDNISITGDTWTDLSIDAGSGDDAISLAGTYDDITVKGGDGNDSLDVTAASFDVGVIDAGAGDDTVFVGRGQGTADRVDGGTGNDILAVSLTSADYTDAVRAELQSFLAFAADQANQGKTFTFATLGGLQAKNFERVQLQVDGVPIFLDNRAPVPGESSFATTEDAVLHGALSAVDPDGDAVSYTLVDGVDVTLNSNGTFSFDPTGHYDALKPGESQQVAFTYRVSDSHGGETEATAIITVTGVNDAPVVAAPLVQTTNEDAAPLVVDLLAQSSDVEGDALLATGLVQTGGRSVTFSQENNTLTLAPGQLNDLAVGESESLTFSYTVSDGTATVAQTLTVTVEGRNDTPVAVADAFAITKGQAITIPTSDLIANDQDVDGDTLSVVSVSNAVGGTVSLLNGVVTFTPTAGFQGDARFDYVIADPYGAKSTATVAVDVAGPGHILTSLVATDDLAAEATSATASYSSVTVLKDGTSIMVWRSGSSLLMQKLDATGHRVGSASSVSTTLDTLNATSVVALDGGGFVVTWQSTGQNLQQQLFNSAGQQVGAARTLYKAVGFSNFVSTSALPDGGWITVWYRDGTGTTGYDVEAQRFTATGTPVGVPVIVNQTTTGSQNLPAVATLADGGWVIAWHSVDSIQVRHFKPDGTAVGPETWVGATTLTPPVVAGLANGGWAVAWYNGTEVYTRTYDSTGQARSTVQVNTYSPGAQNICRIAALADGGFVVVWQGVEYANTVATDVYAQRFDGTGQPVGQEFRLNAVVIGNESQVSVAPRSDGGFVVTWTEGTDIMTRVFSAATQPPVVDAVSARLGQGTSITATALALEGHVNGAALVQGELQQLKKYEFIDNGTGAGSGHFELDGVAVSAGTVVRVSAADLGRLRWVAGQSLGSEGYQVRAFDGNSWSGWSSGTVTTDPRSSSLTTTGDLAVETGTTAASRSATAVLADGTSVVVWLNGTSPGTLLLQKMAPNGARIGSPVAVSPGMNSLSATSVVALAGGGFVVTWQSSGQNLQQQLFNSAGQQLGQVRTVCSAVGFGNFVSASALPDGGWITVWYRNGTGTTGYDIEAQRFTADGTPVGEPVVVNQTTTGSQNMPAVTTLADGGWVIAWHSVDSIQVRRFKADGTAMGAETWVGSTTLTPPVVAGLANGGWVVAWYNGTESYARVYDSAGRAGSTVQVNTYTPGAQNLCRVAALADGGFVVVWQGPEYASSSATDVYGQRFDGTGQRVGQEFRLNAVGAGNETEVSVAARSDGGFVVSWTEGTDVMTRVFSAAPAGTGVVTGTAGADTLGGTAGTDTLIGGQGADVFLAGNNSGADVIYNVGSGGDGDKVLFAAGITADQLWFEKAGYDLRVSVIGTGDRVNVTDWYVGSGNRVASFQLADGSTLLASQVENLVSAMAGMTPPALGHTQLNAAETGVLEPVIAANWQH